MEASLQKISAALIALSNVSGWTIVSVVVGAGTVAMALVQVLKELTPMRRIFQRWWIERWIAVRFLQYRPEGVHPVEAEKMLVELATGGQPRAFYDLGADQLVAQINAAAQIALENPRAYRALLVTLSLGVEPADLAQVMNPPPREDPSKDYLEARNRVSHRIQRNLDGLQIALGNRWAFLMQLMSIALSAAIIETAVLYNSGLEMDTFLLVLPIAVVGGYLAPVARDLVAALQRLRNP